MRFNKFLSGMTLLAGITFLSGCSNEPYEITREEQYARDFIKTFGLIAPGHDWTAAQHTDVTVNAAAPTTVKIYADFAGETYLFGKYDIEAGSSTLKFDIPKGATNYQLKANGRKLAFTPGQSVDLTNGSRNKTEYQGAGGILDSGLGKSGTYAGVTVTIEENPGGRLLTLNSQTATEALKILTENDQVITSWSASNFKKVTDNFVGYASEFYLFPEFWNTSGHGKNIIGVYWEVEPNTEGAEHLVMYAPENYSCTWPAPIIEGDYWIMRVPFFQGPQKFYTPYKSDGTVINFAGNSSEVTDAEYYKSKGIHVKFNKEIKFGFYLQQDNWVMYSETKLNEYVKKKNDDGVEEWRRPSYAATYKQGTDTEGNDKRHLCFEDWYEDNWDLNDMVFRVYGFDNIADKNSTLEKGKVIDIYKDDNTTDKAFQWIVACEDLGGTDDYDFNDVVFGVEHVSGEREVKVTALAAGGTLKTKLYLNGHEVTGGARPTDGGDDFYQYTADGSGKTFDEWHKWFGDGSYPHTAMINTTSFGGVGATVVLVLPQSEADSFSMAAGNAETSNLGGFTVQVTSADGSTITEIKAPQINEDGSITNDNFPQMFVTTGNYKWPKERTPIYESHVGDINQNLIGTFSIGGKEYKEYTNSFHDWVQNNSEGFHAQEPKADKVIIWKK